MKYRWILFKNNLLPSVFSSFLLFSCFFFKERENEKKISSSPKEKRISRIFTFFPFLRRRVTSISPFFFERAQKNFLIVIATTHNSVSKTDNTSSKWLLLFCPCPYRRLSPARAKSFPPRQTNLSPIERSLRSPRRCARLAPWWTIRPGSRR